MRGNWIVRHYEGCFHDGIRVLVRRHMAFLDDDGVHWDYAETDNQAVSSFDDPWDSRAVNEINWDHERVREVWDSLPEPNRAWLEVAAVLPYDAVLAVDPEGDEICKFPHIFVSSWHDGRPPYLGTYVGLRTIEQWGPLST